MKLTSLIFITLIAVTAWSQEMINQTYTADLSVIANPERGLYHHTEVHSENYVNLNSETLQSYRESEAITQILRVFYLEKYRDKAISQRYLDNMRKDFAAIRTAGIKCIVRFAYSTGTSAPYNDATPEMVQVHIGQLKPILRENADVIQVMQAGFVGTWGEWYYTDHFAQSPGQLTADDWQNRRDVVNSLLDALPKDRMVQIRTPGYKMNLFDTEEALTESTAFDGSNISRSGHHNDCFVASPSDYGTYVNPDVEKPFLEQETRFTPMGGETCNVAPPYSDCDNSLSELQRFHWSYLNVDYNTNVLSVWQDEGCYDEVELNLGYRIRMTEASISNKAKATGSMNLAISLINDGYANLYNPRDLYAVLVNTETNEAYKVKLDTDPRLWSLNEELTITSALGIPEGMDPAQYQVHLWMPDSYESLSANPAYAVHFTNENTWQEETGFNNLNLTLEVSNDPALPDYNGDRVFEPIGFTHSMEVEGASNLTAHTGNNTALLVWPPQEATLNRVVQRSEDGGSFTTIASLGANTLSFKDTDVTTGATYQYRYFLSDGNSQTAFSDTVEVTVSEEKLAQIVVDGTPGDWYDLPPAGFTSQEGFSTTRIFFGAKEAYFFLENCTSYELSLDADNSTETGDALGMDYRFQDGGLFEFQNNNWEQIAELNEAQNGANIEFSILLENLPLASSTIQFTLKGATNSQTLSNGDSETISIFRSLPPDTPQNLTIAPDKFTPYSIELNWDECQNCDGYFIERSTSETDGFEIVQEFNSTRTSFRDFELPQVEHFYRMSAHNELGQSNYSEVVSMVPTVLLSVDTKKSAVYPNPTANSIHFDQSQEQAWVISLDGSVLFRKTNTHGISLQHLPNGIYIIKTQTGKNINRYRVVRQ